MRQNIVLAVFLPLSSLSLPCNTTTAVVEFAFEGRVDGIGLPVFGLNPAIGTAVTGSFSYDTALTVPPTSSYSADYQISSPYTFSAYIDGTRIESGGELFSINVVNDFAGNVEDVLTITTSSPIIADTQTTDGVFGVTFASTNPNTFASLSLPEQLTLSDFAWHNGVLTRSGNNQEILTFSIDRLTPVPLPSAWFMLLSGLGVIAVLARRKFQVGKSATDFSSTC